MLKIVHTADLHLDSAFEGFGGDQARVLAHRQAFRDNLFSIVSYAQDIGAHLLLIAGDILDGDSFAYETQEALTHALRAFSGRVAIVLGNHDGGFRKNGLPPLPDNVTVFSGRSITQLELPEHNAVLYGASFDTQYCEKSLLSGFCAADDGRLHIMLMHGEVRTGSLYNPITVEDIANSGLTYLALGHEHSFSGFKKAGKTTYACPGCPQGRGFDETGQKGFIAGEICAETCNLSFVPLERPQYFDIQLDISDLPLDAIAQKLREMAQQPEIARGVVRVRLSGERIEPIDPELLHSKSSDAFDALTIKDASFEKRALWAGLHQDTLEGVFLTKMRTLYDSTSDAQQRRQLELAVRFALSAMEGRENPL